MSDAKRPEVTPGGTLKLDAGEETTTGIRTMGEAETQVIPSSGESTESEPRAVDPRSASFGGAQDSRYAATKLLGRGGMGEVRLCHDGWVGRDVALKVIRQGNGSGSDALARFLREARVQGQLEHPSIVPVYDIGVGTDGAAFFTMKRVKGLTLAEIIEGLRDGEPGIVERYTRRRLLGALSSACQALSFAHSRGVVHRDLKPANLMLGDFGEVYVLDWGIAKIRDVPDECSEAPLRADVDGAELQTRAGALVGTPGYMSPEQVRGDVDRVGPASDIYAMGTILYEVLALEPFHRGATLDQVLVSTLTEVEARPRARAAGRDVAPELDDLCARATALAPEDRLGSVRELHEALERFMDGQRDSERRAELASAHVAAAKEALDCAGRGENAEAERNRAMRELGAALALEPTHRGALEGLVQVLSAEGDTLPPEAEAEIAEVNRRDRRGTAKAAALIFGGWWLGAPLLHQLGVTNWTVAIVWDLLLFSCVAYNVWMWRTGNTTPKFMRWSIPLSFVVVGQLSLVFGPFVLVPGAAVAMAASLMIGLRANKLTRLSIAAFALAAVFVPALFELVGLLPSSYSFEDGTLRIKPFIVEGFSPVLTLTLLALGSAMIVVGGSVSVARAVDAAVRVERRNFARAWRLKHLLPEGAEGSTH